MATKISALPLNELYTKKITPSVETAIQSKEDFTSIAPDYCENVCKLKCKRPKAVHLLTRPVDILIIQDHSALKGKYDRRDDGQEVIQMNILEFICREAGFNGLNYKVVNLLKCAPDPIDFVKGKAPSATIISKCKPYLLSEIERCKPKAIISLSTAVTKVLGYKKHSNTNNRGEVLDNKIVVTLHPRVLSMIRQNASGKMWGNDYFQIIKRDFEKAAAIARGTLKLPLLLDGIEAQRKNITVCRNLQDVMNMAHEIAELPESALVSCDTETTGLDGMADNAKLLCIQFGWKDPTTKVYKAVVVPLWHRVNTWFNPDLAWDIVVPILESSEIKKVGHNFKFDYLYIYHTTGIRVNGFEFDTMLLMHALDSGVQGCYSLKTAMWDHCLELGIAGYEDLLPKLTKKKKESEDGEDNEEGEDAGD